MGRFLNGLAALGLCLSAGALSAQDFAYDVNVGGTTGSVEVPAGEEFTVDLTLASSDIAGDAGPQGWSLGLANSSDHINLDSVTLAGTVSAGVADGGLVNVGFQVQETVNPDLQGGQGQGCVSAVVLSFTMPITLPPNSTQTVLKAVYTAGGSAGTDRVEYRNGLRGSGQPVNNDVTFEGQTFSPTLGGMDIVVVTPPDPEDTDAACSDGIDNDRDGATDCDDSDCAAFARCLPESDCADGVDNDEDGATDCDDSDCAEVAVCLPESNCGDGVDNDEDGDTDCDDSDCVDDGACVPGATGLFLAGPETVLAGAMFDVTASIGPANPADPPADGAQGWSIGISHDAAIVTGVGTPTTMGTDAGRLASGGFEKTQFVDPAVNGGANGLVSAVVLSFTQPITLDPAVRQSILRATYVSADTLVVPPGTTVPAPFLFADGLQGAGQPVDTVLTILGATVEATPGVGTGTTVRIASEPPPPDDDVFLRGDANNDAKVDIADPIWTINMLVRSGPMSPCARAADSNDDGAVDLSDAMYTIEYRFLAGPVPPAPFPACGAVEAIDTLSCENSSCP